MSALPCPVANPFAAADQAYAAITGFLVSKEACQVNHSELERQWEGMASGNTSKPAIKEHLKTSHFRAARDT